MCPYIGEDTHYDVEIALSAEDAEEKFASHEPALTILELTISGGVGHGQRPTSTQRTDARTAPVPE